MTADNPSYAIGQATAAIAAAAIAGIYAAEQKRATEAQERIAKRIQDRADQLHAVWANSYLPCELSTLSEVCSEPKQVADLVGVSQRARAEISKQYALARRKALYTMPANCIGAVCETEYRLAIDEAKAKSWSSQAAMRYEEQRVELANAQRLNNKMLMLNAGRGHAVNATNALASAANILDGLGKQAAGAFNGALATAGRFLNNAIEGGAFNGLGMGSSYNQALQIDPQGMGISSTEAQVTARQSLRDFDSKSDQYYGASASASPNVPSPASTREGSVMDYYSQSTVMDTNLNSGGGKQ